MKHSIRSQMTIIFVGLIIFILLVFLLVNENFLEHYYVYNKKADFKKVYNVLKTAAEEDRFNDNDIRSEIEYLAENGNIAIMVLDMTTTNIRYEHVHERDRETIVVKLLGYILGQEMEMPKEILEDTENYQISSSIEVRNEAEYLEMWGQFDNDNIFILRSPLESIRESVKLSNRFVMYVGGVVVLISWGLVWYFARMLTNPIHELTVVSKKMTELDFDAKYTSGGDNEIGVLGTNFNMMSERLEETITELKNANYELQRDIEQKEKQEQIRTEFLGNVSHELKTPIALIQGYAEGLKEGVKDDSESRDFYCDVIVDEAMKMNQMVRNLMMLNQLEVSDDTQLERFNITALIQGVLQSYEIMLQQKEAKVQFLVEDPLFVWGDQFKIEQVIRNYITNAINHLGGDKIIEIESMRLENKAWIGVFNSGEQISAEDIERIWDKFYKIDKSHAREYGGNGIGLSIVKAIMESLKQKYGVRNYDNGVEFWFELDIK